ncbi:MAG: acylphosphatase, partial [Methanotrichaceae archaeon]|nr:acylphosphatase [Methanotrichaceae archaeon]
MQRVEILARGDVQRVGFRDVVQKIARDQGISGTVENLEPYDVRIVAEGQEDALKGFVRAIRVQKRPIKVQELEVSWATATGEFPYFKIVRGKWQDELGERLDFASGILYRTADLVEENLAISKENLAVSKENLAVSKENLTISKEILGISKENLGISKENLGISKENLGISKENL